VVRNPETINIYIYNCQLITYDMFDIIYIYMYVRCKSMVPHLPGEGLWILSELHAASPSSSSSSSTLTTMSEPSHNQIISRACPDHIQVISI
jgi:hypothetical protein